MRCPEPPRGITSSVVILTREEAQEYGLACWRAGVQRGTMDEREWCATIANETPGGARVAKVLRSRNGGG